MKENKVYIGIGSNIGDREKNLKTSKKEIEKFAKIKKSSQIYETEPVGYKDQDEFLNQVIEIETELTPTELIVALQEIEHSMGRVKKIKDGPRIIDLDILLYNDESIKQKGLIIPHIRMHKRNFVLKPLKEIASEIKHPIFKRTIAKLDSDLKDPNKATIWTPKE